MIDSESFHLVANRRNFITAGALATTGLVIASCKKEKKSKIATDKRIDIGTGDIGVLNYALCIEQVQTELYRLINENPYVGMTPDERDSFIGIYEHDYAHNAFFNAVLRESTVGEVTVYLGDVTFSDRTSVLTHAIKLKNLCIAALNHAAQIINSGLNIEALVNVVSVEARHAAYLTDLMYPGQYLSGDARASYGMEKSLPIELVLLELNKYIPKAVNGDVLQTLKTA